MNPVVEYINGHCPCPLVHCDEEAIEERCCHYHGWGFLPGILTDKNQSDTTKLSLPKCTPVAVN